MAAAAALTVVPSGVLGRSGNVLPSSKLNIAGIGVGGVGRAYLQGVGSENIVALCDVDEKYAANTYKQYPGAKIYRDFRNMLEKEKNIDAVVIGTPDHTHAVIASMAIKMGKHVYCAKPLTKTIYEARMLTEAARKAKVCTQMSVQSDASEAQRLLCEWIWGCANGYGTAPSARYGKFTSGRTGRYGLRELSGPKIRRRCLPAWTGTCGWGRLHIGLIIRLTYHSNGEDGGILAPERWAIWAATLLLISSEHLSLGIRPAFMPAQQNSSRKRLPRHRQSIMISQLAMACLQ